MSIIGRSTSNTFDFDRQFSPQALRPPSGFLENFEAAWNFQKRIVDIGTDAWQSNRMLWDDIAKYEEVTGNTFDIGEYVEEFDPIVSGREQLVERFRERISAWELESGQSLEIDTDYDRRVTEAMREQAAETAGVQQAASGMGVVGGLLGSLAGGFTDPVILATSVIGGAGISLRVSLGRGMLIEGAFGAAVEAAATPSVAGQMERAGIDMTFADMAANVAVSAVASAGLYGAIRGGAQGIAALRREISERTRFADLDPAERRAAALIERMIDEADVAPFRTGDALDARIMYRNIDQATEQLLSGRMVEPVRVEIDNISFAPIDRARQQVLTASRAIEDPDARALFVRAGREQLALLEEGIRTAQARAEQVALDVETGRAAVGVRALREEMLDTRTRIRELEDALDAARVGELGANERMLAYLPDEITQGRVQGLLDQLAEPNLPARQRNALEREADMIFSSVQDELVRNIEADLEATRLQVRPQEQRLSQEMNRLRQTPTFRDALRRARQEAQQDLTQRLLEAEARGAAMPGYSSAYQMTPYRAVMGDIKNMAVERAAQGDPVPAPQRLEAARAQAEQSPDTPVAVADPESGQVRTTTMRELMRELDEDKAFLDAFRECRYG